MNKKILFAAAVLILASLACQLPFLGSDEVETDLPGLESESFNATVEDPNLLAPVPLSPAQAQLIGVNGPPNRFVIQFVSGMREETWHYDHLGFEVTFRNGEIFNKREREIPQDGEGFTSSSFPWQFKAEMGLSELIAVTRSESFGIESLDELVEGEALSIVYLQGVDAGLRDGKILYVRAIPFNRMQGVGDSTAPGIEDQTTTDNSLTPAEQSHSGTNYYEVYCTYSDGTSEEYEESVSWEFRDDGLYYGGDGPFPKVDVNFYSLSTDEDEFNFYFQENVVTLTAKFYEFNEAGDRTAFSAACVYTLK